MNIKIRCSSLSNVEPVHGSNEQSGTGNVTRDFVFGFVIVLLVSCLLFYVLALPSHLLCFARSLTRSLASWPTMQRSIRPFIIGAISCRITITAQVNNDANTSRAHYDQIASEAAARPQQGTERSGACQGNPFLKSNAARERCIRRRDWYAP